MTGTHNTLIERIYAAYLESRHATTDSRQVRPGSLFFALRGEHTDGHAFIPQALAAGAALCVTDRAAADDSRVVHVPDVLGILQMLASHHRHQLDIPVLAITGTNGKTTTKELVHAVLARRYRTAATAGNFNNHLGVPLTLLAIAPDAELAVVEMGANHPGEIDALCHIADPDHGLITNVGRAHLEGFGSFEGVVQTKTELFRHLAARRGTAFVCTENARLLDEAQRLATLPGDGQPELTPVLVPQTPSLATMAPLSVVTYGTSPEAAVRGTLTGADPYMSFYFERGDSVYTVRTRLLGAYNFQNAMAAVAVGLHFGVDPFDIKEALEAYTPSNNRSQFVQTAHNRLYLDCYNANPSSMAAAVDSFAAIAAPRKAAIIGAMKELGDASRREHQALADRLAAAGLQRLIVVGPEFDGISLPDGACRLPDTDALRAHLEASPLEGYAVLVKGSNSNRLWTVVDLL